MISAFGVRAQAFAAGMGDLEAVVADTDSLGSAFIEAVRRRELGQPFYGMVLYADPRVRVILGVAHKVLEQLPNFDDRRIALNRLAAGRLIVDGKPAEELWSAAEEFVQPMREFLSLANATLVRSYAEGERLAALVPPLRSIEPVLVEPAVPDVAPRIGTRPGVVIWAPNFVTSYVAWHAMALAEFFGNVICVTGGGAPPEHIPAQFVGPLDPALPELLASVQCVLCPDPEDPGAAVAFARRGFGIAAPLASGAHEYVRDLATFDFRSQREIELAVKIAITRPASIRSTPQPPRAPALPVLPAMTGELPLVSVMVGTYNRPADLELCLKSLAAQTYPRIEAVVLNDAGENVDHVVARFPFARPVNIPVNGGVLKLIAEGFKHLRGSYVQFLADDDILYPDHIERLMCAALRTGAEVVHGNAVIRYQDRGADGSLVTSGFNARVFNDSATPSEALTSTPIAGQALIYRRDIFDEIGYFRLDTALADQEFQMRAANRYVFAYIDQMTNEWRLRGKENASVATDGGAELRRVFEEIHPVTDRPLVEQSRRSALEGFEKRPKGYVFPPTITLQRGG